MEHLRFVSAMAKGQHPQQCEPAPENSTYCIFSLPCEEEVVSEGISTVEGQLLLELWYMVDHMPGTLRIRQQDTNVIVQESSPQRFLAYLGEKPAKYIGHMVMYALLFKIETMGAVIDNCTNDMKVLEDGLDNCIDNSGTYKILDFRRQYVQYGASIINLQQIIARIDKGYYPMQMQNSYVLQGEVSLAFSYLSRRYDLVKSTIIKDLDTYTSIINNNINRSDRALSVISLVGVVLNFLFGSLLLLNPALGIAGGLLIAGLSVGATLFYRVRRRNALHGGGRPVLARTSAEELEVVAATAQLADTPTDGPL